MNKYKIYGIGMAMAFTSCNDSFMDRFPESDVTNETFFSNVTDLESYSNTFYKDLSVPINDVLSDNISIYGDDNELQNMMVGNLSSQTIDEWEWDKLRKYNFLLENAHRVKGEPAKIAHYVGIARLFRAIDYYAKVKKYNNVPWYSKTLTVNDKELLYKEQDPRVIVVDSIMADLDFAAKNIESDASKTRITKAAALAIQARVALHEGTFRKYHAELNLSDGNRFLQVAAKSCQELINMSVYTLHPVYGDLFNTSDLSKNPEIILYRDYDIGKEIFNNTKIVFDYSYGLSQDLINSYLYTSGNGETKPFTSLSGYQTISYVETFKNRDSRMKATICYPGYVKGGETKPYLITPDRGGYIQSKYAPTSTDQWSWATSYIDVSLVRLAEVYLTYAEAKAELGELTQADLDNTVNLLRERAKMPAINLAVANTQIDPQMEKDFPNVSGVNKGIIYELRRERRVELACEGFRFDDVNRWKAGKLFAKKMEGIYIPSFGPIDVTGDGIPDIAILAKPSDKNTLPEELQKTLALYFMENENGIKATFYLSEGDKGHILFEAQRSQVRDFMEPKYYYRPMSQQDMKINPNLKETIFW